MKLLYYACFLPIILFLALIVSALIYGALKGDTAAFLLMVVSIFSGSIALANYALDKLRDIETKKESEG